MTAKSLSLRCKKISVFFIIAFILINILFSYQFIIENAHHTCSDEHCPICVQLEDALQFIQSIKHIPTLSFLVTVLFLFIKWVPHVIWQLRQDNTLITLKVELLN